MLFTLPSGATPEVVDRLGEVGQSRRLQYWRKCLRAAWQHPVLGIGPMHYAWPPFDFMKAAHPHNAFLQWLAEWGVPSTAIMSGLAICGSGSWVRQEQNRTEQSSPSGNATRVRDAVRVGLVAAVLAGTAHAMGRKRLRSGHPQRERFKAGPCHSVYVARSFDGNCGDQPPRPFGCRRAPVCIPRKSRPTGAVSTLLDAGLHRRPRRRCARRRPSGKSPIVCGSREGGLGARVLALGCMPAGTTCSFAGGFPGPVLKDRLGARTSECPSPRRPTSPSTEALKHRSLEARKP